MSIQEHRRNVRQLAGPHQDNYRFVVIPNNAPAYSFSGPWGIYDIERCEWRNFRATKAEAEFLRDTIETGS
jgi:hypothetical protein